jgi:bacterial/archaeal transporter family-2 protein
MMKSGIDMLLVIGIGLIGGIAVGIQGPMSGAMSGRLGPISSSFIIHAGGAILSGILLLLRNGENLKDWRAVPTPYLFAGVFGVILYLTFSYTLPRIGVVATTTLLIAAQLGLALLIDHMGWFGVPQHPIDLSRLAGVGLLLAASFLITR